MIAAQVMRHNASASLSRMKTEREDFRGFHMGGDQAGFRPVLSVSFLFVVRAACHMLPANIYG